MNQISLNSEIQLLDSLESEGEAFASVTLNPHFQWAKIVVTDDQKNANNQRIPLNEFDNLIKTGIHAPIKMAEGQISDGHKEAMGKPIGVITNLVKVGNQLIALAALWKKEREEDIVRLKDMFSRNILPQVSWEISYAESSLAEDGTNDLIGTNLDGLAIVGMPAYEGRTSIFAMASKENLEENITMEELEELKNKVSALETSLAEKDTLLTQKDEELNTLKSQVAELQDFKNGIEEEKAKAEKLQAIKVKFQEAKLEKDNEYFVSNSEKLLAYNDEQLDFMIQELVSFAQLAQKEQSSTSSKTKIPPFSGKTENSDDVKELAKLLRAQK